MSMHATLPNSVRNLCLAASIILLSVAASAQNPQIPVGPQYDTTHVYTDSQHFDALVHALIATFGGHATPRTTLTVTPTPSSTESQLVLNPVGTLSIFAFSTPLPAPFGGERTGYLVRDLDSAVSAAKASGAEVLVQPFPDPVGKDAVVRWSGGLETQLYWHTKAPQYEPLQTIPENRLYVSEERASSIAREFVQFSGGRIVSDERNADAAEIGKPGQRFRRIRVQSNFGKLTLLVSDGHLTYPFGHKTTGYEVVDLNDVIAKAKASGANVLVGPLTADQKQFAVVAFPGGYIAEIHTSAKTSSR